MRANNLSASLISVKLRQKKKKKKKTEFNLKYNIFNLKNLFF